MAKKKVLEANLTKEVAALASHISKALKAAKDSEALQGVKAEALGGLRATSSRIVAALEKAKKSDSLHDIKAQAQKVLDAGKIRGEQTVETVSENLALGLRHISKELASLADRLNRK